MLSSACIAISKNEGCGIFAGVPQNCEKFLLNSDNVSQNLYENKCIDMLLEALKSKQNLDPKCH